MPVVDSCSSAPLLRLDRLLDMCGRYGFFGSNGIADRFGARLFEEDPTGMSLVDRVMVAPTDVVPVIVRDPHGDLVLRPMSWGLIPHWVQPGASWKPLINARAETLLSKPSFRDLVQTHHCVVPSRGFYEWTSAEGGKKRPMMIHRRDGEWFAFAGLWDIGVDRKGVVKPTFTIVTEHAREPTRLVHDRQPVMLSREGEAWWMGNPNVQGIDDMTSVLFPFELPATDLEMIAVR